MLRSGICLGGLAFLCSFVSFGQSEEDSIRKGFYNSLISALQSPNDVRELNLSGPIDYDSLELIAQFPNMKTLQLENFPTNVAPEFISNLTQLEELRFVNDAFDSIPRSYSRLTNLRRIDFVSDENLDLEKTFNVLSELPRLEELRIEGFDNSTLTDALVFPPQLQILSMRNNRLNSIPAGVSEINGLRLLDIGENNLTTLPKELSGLRNLRTLYLDHEAQMQFDQTFDMLSSFPQLEVLHVDKSVIERANTSWKNKTPEQLLLDPNLLNSSPYYMPNSTFMVPQTTVPQGDGKETIRLIPISK